jgi:hypothetical protein
MGDTCLNFAKRETERLDMEIELLQGKIRHHNEIKDAWEMILRNPGGKSHSDCLDIANTETERLNREIEAVQEEIRRHAETRDAWETIMRKAESKSQISRRSSFVSGKDGQWHQQLLNREIEVLQGEILRHNETKAALATILHNAGGESFADCMEIANSETERLNGEIEMVQEAIRRHIETRDAWDTIMRNAEGELRVYHGATYVRGEDRQWHLQSVQASQSHEEELETVGDRRMEIHAVSKVSSMRQALVNACEKTFRGPQIRIDVLTQGKQQFQSLGLN